MRSRAAGSRAAARIWRFCLPGQMAVEPGLVDDGSDTSERRVAMRRDGVSEQGHRAGIGVGQSQQHPDERGLAGAVGTEVAERTSPGDKKLHTVHGDVLAETLGQPMGLHGPAALGGQLAGGVRESRRVHLMPSPYRRRQQPGGEGLTA